VTRDGGVKLTATVERVTPEMASRLLGTMDHNRKMRRATVERFAREMIAGRWQLNGEPIILDKAGKLKDGQHRLNAIVAAKVPVHLLVVRGIEEAAMATIDTGSSRSYGDVITLRGGSSVGATMAAIARWWWLYENTEYVTAKTALAHQEMDLIVAQHSNIENSALRAHRSKFKRFCPVSVLGFVYSYLCEKQDADLAELFFTDMEKGANLDEDDPIFVLRRRLLEMERRDAREILALVIKGYNEWIDGTRLQVLVWRSGEQFPRFGSPSKNARRARAKKAAPNLDPNANANRGGTST
jgi:hypothetical protein